MPMHTKKEKFYVSELKKHLTLAKTGGSAD